MAINSANLLRSSYTVCRLGVYMTMLDLWGKRESGFTDLESPTAILEALYEEVRMHTNYLEVRAAMKFSVGGYSNFWRPYFKFLVVDSSCSVSVLPVLLRHAPNGVHGVGYWGALLLPPWPTCPPWDLRLNVLMLYDPGDQASTSNTGGI